MLQVGVVWNETHATAVNSHQGLGHCKVLFSHTTGDLFLVHICAHMCLPDKEKLVCFGVAGHNKSCHLWN